MRLRRLFLALALVGLAMGGLWGAARAAATPGPRAAEAPALWTDVDEATVRGGERPIVPTRYRTVAADLAALDALLAAAPPSASRGAPVVLPLPLPDGTLARFLVEEAPIMEAGLAARFAAIRTYRAQGLDDPAATARLDRTPAGFHAMVRSSQGTLYIDPYRRGDTTHYLSYWKRDFQEPLPFPFEPDFLRANPQAGEPPERRDQPQEPSGDELRTYRLAVAATGEYTQFHGGTVADGLAAVVTSVNRVVGIYEVEVAVRMVLVANNDDIIYTNGATDPYTNNNGFAMLGQNQANLDAVIGNANYDVGHVFSTGGGGVASLGVPCRSGQKARGVTGSPAPIGDPFDVDYVAHEMGHQFGANHTFNGTTSSCGGGNRYGPTAYEPGSGSTIMAYAGICGSENLQPNSDDDFHTISFDEIVDYTVNGFGDTCAVTTPTGNAIPTVNAGPDYSIPAETPFQLTGSATDANGDALLYDWEQFDLGSASPPNTDNGNRPIFRSFLPSPSPTRFFPRLEDLLGNTSTLGESLPTTTRNLTFRLTARDNRAGGGGVNYDTAEVNVTSAAGPFLVTAPNTAVTWSGNSSQTVTWDVAGTNVAPVSCAAVNILLSTDGGLTFPTSLASATPNDGSESIPVPNTPTGAARVKVECAGNIFFDLSNANFTIVAGGITPTPSATASPTITASPTATATASPSVTATITASSTASPTATPSITASPTATATATEVVTETPTPTATASPEPEEFLFYLPLVFR